MLAAYSGAAAICNLLIQASADTRRRLTDGRSALDMGNTDTARAIRLAREERNKADHQQVEGQKGKQEQKSSAQGRQSKPSAALMSLKGGGRAQGKSQSSSKCTSKGR